MADTLSSALNVGPVDRAVRAPTSKPTPEPKMDQESVLQKQVDEGRTKAADLIGQMSEFNAVKDAHAAEQKGKEAETQARLIREEKDKITGSDPYKQLQDTELSIAREQFHPTERSIGENLALAAATTIMGHMIGKGGKVPATITLAGMNGMMEGIRAGDLNRYKEQKQKFEDGLNNLVRKGQVLSKGLERITKLAAIDKEEAYYEAQALFAKENADFMRQYADKYGIPKLYELNQANLKKAEELLAKYQLKDKERQDRAAQARLQAGLREPKVVGQTPDGYGVYLMPDGTEKVGTTKLTLGKKGAGAAPSGLNVRYAFNISEAAQQAGTDLLNITQMPKDTVLGTFSDMTGLGGNDLTTALRNTFTRKIEKQDRRQFQQLVSGFEMNMSRALGGGYANSGAARSVDAYKQQVARSGDTPLAMATFLARAKQELTILEKQFAAHPGANEGEISQLKGVMDEVRKSIPFDVKDVLKASGKNRETIESQTQEMVLPKAPSNPRPSDAPADATLAPDGEWYSPDPDRPGKYKHWG